MNIREKVIKWLSRTEPRYTFVTDVEWERSESLKYQDVPSSQDIIRDDPWRPKSTLGPM